MRIAVKFVGRNKDFRAWLAAGMPANVVGLAEYRRKRKAARRAARVKPVSPSIA